MSGQLKGTFVERVRREFIDPLLNRRFIRFLLIGGINTAFSYTVYATFLLVGLGYALANLLALIAGILFSFKTQGTFVFNNAARGSFLRFVICWLLIYLCNIAFIRQMLILGLDAYSAGALAIPPIVVISYLVQKHFVFNKKGRPAPDL
jgi:putative flippase GtrA